MSDPVASIALLLDTLTEEAATYRGDETTFSVPRTEWERMNRLGAIKIDVTPWEHL